ncbi:MAG TPA: hypothetical protein VGC54_12435 [Planctomycetota bacterium]
MSRALGLHRVGDQVDYALVDAAPGRPPEVLAAGRTRLDEVVAMHARLSGERPLIWGIAEEREDQPIPTLRADWPLQRPQTRAAMHPAVAAALWEWELGRIQDEDLFVWLRPERLLWSSGEPGSGNAGSVPRRGPLRQAVKALRKDAQRAAAPVALATDGDAPGAAVVDEVFSAEGFATRRVRGSPGERGVDRAAAGAALGALDPTRPGVFSPRRERKREPLHWKASVIAATAVGAAAWLDHTQAAQLEALRRVSQTGPPQAERAVLAPQVPGNLRRVLDRQAALRHGLAAVLAAVPPGRLEELELLTGPGSSRVQARLRLLPGGTLEDDSRWLRDSGAQELDLRGFADGSVVARAEFEPAASGSGNAGDVEPR